MNIGNRINLNLKKTNNNYLNKILKTKMDIKMDVSLAQILGIENEYDLLNKQAKVCTQQHRTWVS